MDQLLVPRRRLTEVQLAGGRAFVHRVLRYLIGGFAALQLVLALGSTTRSCGEACGGRDAQGFAANVHLVLYVTAIVVVAAQLVGLRQRLVVRLVTAIVSAVAMLVLVVTIALAFMLASGDVGDARTSSATLMLALGVAQIVVEVGLTVRERRLLEAAEPALATARVVDR